MSGERHFRDPAPSSRDDSSDLSTERADPMSTDETRSIARVEEQRAYLRRVPARERGFYLALAPAERSDDGDAPDAEPVSSSTGDDGDPQEVRQLGSGLKARLNRINRVTAARSRHRSATRASKALHIGIGTEADLNVLYEEQEQAIREKLVTLGIRRVLEPNVQGYRLWYWASRILACPPKAEVSHRYRKALAERAALENPYERLRRQRPRLSTNEREDAMNEWIVEQLCWMFLQRHDELELRREVADRVPTDPVQQRAYRRAWQAANDAKRRTSS